MSVRARSVAWSPGALGPLLADGAPDLSWQGAALCAQADPEAWYPEKGGSVREAKRICGACPVRAACLEFALDSGEIWGIWGGLSERQRRPLLAAREHGPGAVREREPAAALCRSGRHLKNGPGRCAGCIAEYQAKREPDRDRDYAAVYARRVERAREKAAA
jgi:WhiB family transcriptional regulator, redox-sensing transcriptional regulator